MDHPKNKKKRNRGSLRGFLKSFWILKGNLLHFSRNYSWFPKLAFLLCFTEKNKFTLFHFFYFLISIKVFRTKQAKSFPSVKSHSESLENIYKIEPFHVILNMLRIILNSSVDRPEWVPSFTSYWLCTSGQATNHSLFCLRLLTATMGGARAMTTPTS